jgi:hypothetical protein
MDVDRVESALLSVAQAAELLNVSRSRAYDLARRPGRRGEAGDDHDD